MVHFIVELALSRKQIAAIKAKSNRRFPKSTEVQTVVLTKKPGMTKSDAVSIVKKAGFKTSKVDEKPNTYRFRQQSPTQFQKKTFRFKKIKKDLQIVVAVPK